MATTTQQTTARAYMGALQRTLPPRQLAALDAYCEACGGGIEGDRAGLRLIWVRWLIETGQRPGTSAGTGRNIAGGMGAIR